MLSTSQQTPKHSHVPSDCAPLPSTAVAAALATSTAVSAAFKACATIERGLEALVEAHANGRPANVAFTFEGDLPAGEGDKPTVLEDDSKEEDEEDETRLTLDGVYDDKCQVCENDPCLFIVNEDGLIDYGEAEHGHLAREDRPANNLRRKKLYRQLTLMINGGPMGAGVRKPLPDCCVDHIREMLPSESFMGYRSE
jgi:hypothetical protein